MIVHKIKLFTNSTMITRTQNRRTFVYKFSYRM